MAKAPVLFFGLELPDTIAYKRSMVFVDFNFTFLFGRAKRGCSIEISRDIYIYVGLQEYFVILQFVFAQTFVLQKWV